MFSIPVSLPVFLPVSPPGSDAFALLPLLMTYYTFLMFNNLAVIDGVTRQMCSDIMKVVTKAVLPRIILINRQKKLAKIRYFFHALVYNLVVIIYF